MGCLGTNLITSKDCPSFGVFYKLACIIDENGTEIPKIKVSENVEKVTNPATRKILRIYDKASGKIKADPITLKMRVFTEDQPLTLGIIRSAGHMEAVPDWKAGTLYDFVNCFVRIIQKRSVSVMNLRLLWTFRLAAHWKRPLSGMNPKRLINPQAAMWTFPASCTT